MEHLTPDQLNKPQGSNSKKLYSKNQVSAAAFLGGPLAGGWLLSRNYRAVDYIPWSKRILLIALIVLFVITVLAMVLPTDFPSAPLASAAPLLAYFWYQSHFESRFAEHIESGGAKESSWKVAGLSIVAFVPTLVLFLIVATVLPLNSWNSVQFDTNTIYYEGNADRESAESLGRFFEENGVFESGSMLEVTLQFPRRDSKLVVIKAIIDVPTAGSQEYDYLEELVALLNDRYYGRRVEFHVQNMFGATVMRIPDN